MTAPTLEGVAIDALEIARECVYRFLSACATDPHSPGWDRVRDRETRALVVAAMDVVREEAEGRPIETARGERGPDTLDLRPLVDALDAPLEALRSQHDHVVGLVSSREFPPYETEYDREGDPFQGAQQLADIAGFYQDFGLRPARNPAERPDHIAIELEFVALLLTKKRLAEHDAERSAVCALAIRDFVADHLCWWAPTFAAGIAQRAGASYLGPFATALSGFIAAERAFLEIPAPQRFPMPRIQVITDPEDESECGSCTVHPS
jgi:TorA maturation chaperone TorD